MKIGRTIHGVLLVVALSVWSAVPAWTADMPCCEKAKTAGLVCSHCTPSADLKAEVGKPAIDFSLKDAEGKDRTLSDNKGKIVVLTWTNPACPFVTRHNQEGTLKKLSEKYGADKVAFLQVDSTDSVTPESTQKTAKEYGQTYPTLLDPSGAVGRMYGAKTTPDVFVIGKDGHLAYEGAIDNDPAGKLKPEERTHYADDAVKALLAGKTPTVQTTKSYGCSVKFAEAPKTDAVKMP